MENGYALCLNKWSLDKEIKNELGLLLIISSLCAEKGYCWASNEYLSNLFNEHETSISRKIKKLESKGYIIVEYEKRGCEIKSRTLRLAKMLTDDYQNCYSTISKNAKENNTSINITSNNNYILPKTISFGEYRRIKLTENEYNKLCEDFTKEFIDNQIQLLDEYVESNNNKNKYKNFNLVIRKSIRDNWFNKQHNEFKQEQVPKWFNQEIKEDKPSEEDMKLGYELFGDDYYDAINKTKKTY